MLFQFAVFSGNVFDGSFGDLSLEINQLLLKMTISPFTSHYMYQQESASLSVLERRFLRVIYGPLYINDRWIDTLALRRKCLLSKSDVA